MFIYVENKLIEFSIILTDNTVPDAPFMQDQDHIVFAGLVWKLVPHSYLIGGYATEYTEPYLWQENIHKTNMNASDSREV